MSAIDEFLILFRTQVQDGGLNKLNSKIKSTRNELFSVKNLLRGFIGYDIYTAVRNLIPAMVQTSQQLGAMKSRFNAVSESARAGADELNWVGEQSKRLGLDFLKTADDYSIFFATVKKNMGAESTRKTFEQWAETFRVLHIAPDRQTRILYALREMSSKGKIYMQDLALQLGSHVPDAMGLAAKAMGYTGPKAVEKFRDAITNGEIDVKKFIPLFSQIVNKTYVTSKALKYAMNQTDAQLQLINTHWQFLQKNILESGMQEDIVNFLKTINKLLGFLEKNSKSLYKWLKIIGGSLVALGITGTAVNLLFLIGKFRLLIATLIELRMAIGAIQLMSGVSVGSGALMGLLGFLLNPSLWIPVAIAAIGAVLMMVIKKYFPNVYNDIMAFWLELRLSVGDFVRWLNETPVFKLLRRLADGLKIGVTEDIKDAQNKRLKQMPNYKFPAKVLGLDDVIKEKVFSMFPQYKFMKSLGVLGKSALYSTLSIQKIDNSINIDGSNIDSSQDLVDKIKEAQSESHNNIIKTLQTAISGSKTFSINPLSLSSVISQ